MITYKTKMPLVFNKSNRGGKLLFCGGFYYHRIRKGYWRCADSRCKIIFRTTGDETTDEVVVTKKFKEANKEFCKHASKEEMLDAYLEWVQDIHIDEYVENTEYQVNLAVKNMKQQVLKI